jgi:hypothetical protein
MSLGIKSPVSATDVSAFEEKISGREFLLQDNDYHIQSVYLTFKNKELSFAIKRDNQISVLKAGSGVWKTVNTKSASVLAPPRPLQPKSIDANYSVVQPVIKVASCYSWNDPKTLVITSRFVEESLGSQAVVCTFSEVNGTTTVTLGPKPMPGMMAGSGRAQPPAVQLRGVLVNPE